MNRLILIFGFLFITACVELDRVEKPEPFIEQEQMAEIIADIYLLDGARTSNYKKFATEFVQTEKYILSKYELDSLSLASNFEWYSDNIDEYLEVMERARGIIEKRAEGIPSEQESSKEDTEEDSLNRARILDSLRAIKSQRKIRPGVIKKVLTDSADNAG